jgi:hypothetical protein
MPKGKLPVGLVFRCQEKGWMTNELMMNWVKVICKQRPFTLLNKRGMLILDSYKGHLTQQVKEKMRRPTLTSS